MGGGSGDQSADKPEPYQQVAAKRGRVGIIGTIIATLAHDPPFSVSGPHTPRAHTQGWQNLSPCSPCSQNAVQALDPSRRPPAPLIAAILPPRTVHRPYPPERQVHPGCGVTGLRAQRGPAMRPHDPLHHQNLPRRRLKPPAPRPPHHRRAERPVPGQQRRRLHDHRHPAQQPVHLTRRGCGV